MTNPIYLSNISKAYQLYRKPIDRLKEAFSVSRKKYHEDFLALKNINLKIEKGEVLGIIGANGSGKSTLLKMISGIIHPSSGEIEIHGKISALLELGAGFNPELSGVENVFLVGSIYGLSEAEIKAKYEEIIDFAEIGEFIEQPVKLYSTGMQVRLAFALATSIEPEIFIVDEALSVGDMYFQNKSLNKMKELIERGSTVLFVSHDFSAIKNLCDRCIYLKNGTIIKDGEPGEVIDHYIEEQLVSSGATKKQAEASKTIKKEIPENQENFEKLANLRRHGSQEIAFQNVSISNQNHKLSEFNYNDTITVTLDIIVKEEVTDAVLAFYVRDKNQVEVLGSNTTLLDYTIPTLQEGKSYQLSFSFQNYIMAGDYSIKVLLANSLTSSNYYDWIDTACLFTSRDIPGKRTWALVTPPMTVDFQEYNGTDS